MGGGFVMSLTPAPGISVSIDRCRRKLPPVVLSSPSPPQRARPPARFRPTPRAAGCGMLFHMLLCALCTQLARTPACVPTQARRLLPERRWCRPPVSARAFVPRVHPTHCTCCPQSTLAACREVRAMAAPMCRPVLLTALLFLASVLGAAGAGPSLYDQNFTGEQVALCLVRSTLSTLCGYPVCTPAPACTWPGGACDPASSLVLPPGAVTDIGGSPRQLSDFKGKVLIVVNVASKCGFTGARCRLDTLGRAWCCGRVGGALAPPAAGCHRGSRPSCGAWHSAKSGKSLQRYGQPHADTHPATCSFAIQSPTTRACSSCTASTKTRGWRCWPSHATRCARMSGAHPELTTMLAVQLPCRAWQG